MKKKYVGADVSVIWFAADEILLQSGTETDAFGVEDRYHEDIYEFL